MLPEAAGYCYCLFNVAQRIPPLTRWHCRLRLSQRDLPPPSLSRGCDARRRPLQCLGLGSNNAGMRPTADDTEKQQDGLRDEGLKDIIVMQTEVGDTGKCLFAWERATKGTSARRIIKCCWYLWHGWNLHRGYLTIECSWRWSACQVLLMFRETRDGAKNRYN